MSNTDKIITLCDALLDAPLSQVAHAVLRRIVMYADDLGMAVCGLESALDGARKQVRELEGHNRELAVRTNGQAGEIARLKEQLRLAAAGALPKPDEPLGKIPMIRALRTFVTASDAAKPHLGLKEAKMLADVLNGAEGEITVRSKGWDGQMQVVVINVAGDIRQINAAARAASQPEQEN